MFGKSQHKIAELEPNRPRIGSWLGAIVVTLIVTGAIFWLVSSATADRQERLFDRGAYSDLQRIGREIDYQLKNLVAIFGSSDPLDEPTFITLPADNAGAAAAGEARELAQPSSGDATSGALSASPIVQTPSGAADPADSEGAEPKDAKLVSAEIEQSFSKVLTDAETGAESAEEDPSNGETGKATPGIYEDPTSASPGIAGRCRQTLRGSASDPAFYGICERERLTGTGRVGLYFASCDPGDLGISEQTETDTDEAGTTKECYRGFLKATPLSLSDLAVDRLTAYAVYSDDGNLAIQADGATLMPAQLSQDRLRRLASEGVTGREEGEDIEVENSSYRELTNAERTVQIAGDKFRIYAIRLDNGTPLMVGGASCLQRECYLVGLAPVRGFWDEITSITPLAQLVFVAVIGLLILAMPILRLATIGGDTAFTRADVAMLALSIPLAAATATLVLSAYANWARISKDADAQIVEAAREIDAELSSSVEKTVENAVSALRGERSSSPGMEIQHFIAASTVTGSAKRRLFYTNRRSKPSEQVSDRAYIRELLARSEPTDADQWETRGADIIEFETEAETGETFQVDYRAAPTVARNRALPSPVFPSGARVTIVGFPAVRTTGGVREAAAIVTAVLGEDGLPNRAPLAATADGFGFAVIDADTSQVFFHHKNRREILEFFNQEVDGYGGTWLSKLAASRESQCSTTSGSVEPSSPAPLFYEGVATRASAVLNCETGWITVAWWYEKTLQFEATDAAILGAAIYLTFFVLVLILIGIAGLLHPSYYRFLWPTPRAGAFGTIQNRIFILYALAAMALGALVVAITPSEYAGLRNILFWTVIVVMLALRVLRSTRAPFASSKSRKRNGLVDRLVRFDTKLGPIVSFTCRKGEGNGQGKRRHRRRYEAQHNYVRSLSLAQIFAVIALAVAPTIVAYNTADTYREQLALDLDRVVYLEQSNADPRPDRLILHGRITEKPPGNVKSCPIRKPRDVKTEKESEAWFDRLVAWFEPINDSCGKVYRKQGFVGWLAQFTLSRASEQIALRQKFAAKLPGNPVEGDAPKLQFVWLLVLCIALVFVLHFVFRLVQRSLFGLQHIQMPGRADDEDLVENIAENPYGKFLLIDCDAAAVEQLAELLRKTRRVEVIDLSIEHDRITEPDESFFDGRSWIVTNVEAVMSDDKTRAQGLRFLELLNSRPEIRIYLFSEIPPLVRMLAERENLARRVAALKEESPEAIEMLTQFDHEQFRWSNLLSDFQTKYCPPQAMTAKTAAALRRQESWCEQKQLIAAEAHEVRYRIAREQLASLIEDKKVCQWSEQEVIVRLQAEMAEYYERQWRICSRAEQLAILHLAEGKFLNTSNFNVVSQLLHRGFIKRRPEFTLMNRSFAHWVRTTDKGRSFEDFRRDAEKSGSWRLLRLPLMIGIVGAISLVGYLNQENIEFMIALLPALLSGVPVLISTLLGGKGTVAR